MFTVYFFETIWLAILKTWFKKLKRKKESEMKRKQEIHKKKETKKKERHIF